MAAIRHAGGALLRRFPAASLRRAIINGERPALRSLQQYPFHRPAAARAAFSTASTQVGISSSPNGCSKKSEEEKKNWRRTAAMMLMKPHCTDDPESEMRSINELFALLDPVTNPVTGVSTELQERRSLFGEKKNALLVALFNGDAELEKEKMTELAAAGRLLRDAVSGQYQLHGQWRDAPKLEEDVADIKRDLKKMMEGQGRSLLEEPAAAECRTLLKRVLVDNREILEMLADHKAMVEEVKESVDTLDRSVDTLEETVGERLEEIEERMGTMEESVKENMESVETSVGRVEESVDSLRERLEEKEERMGTSEDNRAMLEELKESIDDLASSVGTLDERMEEIEENMRSVDNSVKEVKETMESVDESMKDMKETMESLDESVKEVKETIERVEESVEKLKETASGGLDQRYKSVDDLMECTRKVLDKLKERFDQKRIT